MAAVEPIDGSEGENGERGADDVKTKLSVPNFSLGPGSSRANCVVTGPIGCGGCPCPGGPALARIRAVAGRIRVAVGPVSGRRRPISGWWLRLPVLRRWLLLSVPGLLSVSRGVGVGHGPDASGPDGRRPSSDRCRLLAGQPATIGVPISVTPAARRSSSACATVTGATPAVRSRRTVVAKPRRDASRAVARTQ